MVSALVKVVLVALSVLVGKLGGKRVTDEAERAQQPEAPRNIAREWARALDLFFSFALVGSVAWLSGALRVGPLESRGYEAYGELISLLLLFAFKCLLFVLLPAILLYFLLRTVEGLKVRLVVYGLFALGGAGAWHIHQQGEAARTQARAEVEAAQRDAAGRLQREVQSMEEAREIAAIKEVKEHERLVNRLVELTAQVHERWHQDLQAAGAVGFEGDRPPMLAIADEGLNEKRITNLSSGKVCVKLARVLRQPGGYERCPHDVNQQCQPIARRETRTVLLLPAGTDVCRRGLIEYRIGTPLDPEPSWWSLSALAEFDPRASDYRAKYAGMTAIDLRNEEARLEKILADETRAERWKRELL